MLGSIPFGLIITKIFLKEDVRNIGSGNIGATNVLRTGNKLLAALTLVFDVFKGYISIYLSTTYFSDLIYLAALSCFVGHIFPIWLKFKGGKGVATYLGIILAFSFEFAVIFSLTWLIILFIFRYSSLSSISSALLIFLYSLFLNNFPLSLYLFLVFIIILFTHKENIIRLIGKTENKIKF
jgi:glycerol-3-phosphate acyltransferase PlsY